MRPALLVVAIFATLAGIFEIIGSFLKTGSLAKFLIKDLGAQAGMLAAVLAYCCICYWFGQRRQIDSTDHQDISPSRYVMGAWLISAGVVISVSIWGAGAFQNSPEAMTYFLWAFLLVTLGMIGRGIFLFGRNQRSRRISG